MSKVVPGPLPADGTRINVQNIMDRFVGGTRLFDLNTENFAESAMTFLIAASEAPPADRLTRATMWFHRGPGIMKRWTPRPTDSGATGAWLACSVKREMMVQARHPVRPGEVLWSDPSPSENKVFEGGSDEFQYIRVSGEVSIFAGEDGYTSDSNATAGHHWQDMKQRPIPPFFIANESAAASAYTVVTELGFVRAMYTGATDARYGCVLEGSNLPYVTSLTAGFATATAMRVAHMVDSAPEAQTMIVFLHQGPSNLCR